VIDPLTRAERDRATRAIAQDEFRTPLIIEAGAGTGKTALLVARVAAWCLGAGWERHAGNDRGREAVAQKVIEGVAAITFTDAAAAEMASRIGEALNGLAAGETPVGWIPGNLVENLGAEESAARAGALCGEVHRLRVTTIHAFCQRVLAAHPFEAGLHPRFEIDADLTALEALVDEVVLDALRELEQSPQRDLWERLAVKGVGPAKVAAALLALVESGARPADLARDPFDPAAADAFVGAFRTDLAELLSVDGGRLAQVKSLKVAGRVLEALRAASGRLEESGVGASFDDLAAALALLGSDERKKLREWARTDFKKAELKCLGDDVEAMAGAAAAVLPWLEDLGGLDPESFGAARELLDDLLRLIERRRTERGIATYGDLLSKAAMLLDGHEPICAAERRTMDQLLVDEFQDTDDVQCRIVRRLALDGPPAERPGLFVVGDPKQSIYAWRSADLAAYDAFVDEVREKGGEKHPLTSNFRSVTPILDEVERVVEPVMEREHGFQPAFEALDATGERLMSPGFDVQPWSAVEYWICWCPDDEGRLQAKGQKVGDVTALEGRAIAEDIRRLHDDAGVRFGDVAVLLRATTKQAEILDAFRELGIPFEVAREREYYRQREIIEAAGLVRAILEPADALALLTVIRSDAVGVPDVALAPLWDAGLPVAVAALDGEDDAAIERVRHLVHRVAASTDDVPGVAQLPKWPHVLVAAMEALAFLRRSMRDDPPDVFVERLRTRWLAEAAAGVRHLGRFRQARLDRFFQELESTLSRGRGGAAEIARFLRRSVEEGREAPTVSEPDRDSDSVHVMTIYGAKGLDFEHVYLAQIHKETGSFGTPEAVLHRVDGVAELKLFGWPSLGFGAAERRRELQAHAEQVRLLYVAMTRAKQRLVVSGGWPAPGTEIDPLDAGTLADLVARRADPEAIERLTERGFDREADREPGVSWVLPAFIEDDRRRPDDELDEPTTGVDEWSVVADAAAIAKARTLAAARMGARWSRPASDAAHRLGARRDTEIGGETPVQTHRASRDAAAAVGTAVHRLLETLDLGDELVAQVDARRRSVIDGVALEFDADDSSEIEPRIESLIDRISGGRCLLRLAELAPRVVARELEVFRRPDNEDGTSVISGAIDLVYRDPDDGRLVIADYKTDAVEDEAEVAERVERYRPQLETYARALEEALALGEKPHTELWFIHPDRIVRL
jgi:ATP-dependent helicase/nuclease subunit A